MSLLVDGGSSRFAFSDEVGDALSRGWPVVALESNVVAHGFPHPENHDVALQVERAVRDRGAIPATIVIVDGVIQVGVDGRGLRHLAAAERAPKVTRRDLGIALTRPGLGVTSISATMAIAHRVGIRTVASAGLGGVHRGAEDSMDISSDLTELARTRLIVVCAGVKKILDAGRTLEFLETQGTPVIGYGQREFPAFYCRESGYDTQVAIDDPTQIAEIARLHWQFEHSGSILVTHPIPLDDALDGERIEHAIRGALESAAAAGVRGADITPFVLKAVDAATGGQARAANRAVLISTARAAAEIEVVCATTTVEGVPDRVH